MSVLATATKIFERLMQNQLNKHISQFLSPFYVVMEQGRAYSSSLLPLIITHNQLPSFKLYLTALQIRAVNGQLLPIFGL